MLSLKINNGLIFELAKITTNLLIQSQAQLRNIRWNIGESNTDTEYSKLACECCKTAWRSLQKKEESLCNIQMNVTIPDINLCFILLDESISKKIELKSSKSKTMPGSTIGKLDINQPMIYCLRPKEILGTYEVRCSQYHKAMTTKEYDLFVDRTPRPFLSFSNMDNNNSYVHKDKFEWIKHYTQCSLNRINNIECIRYSWQDELVKDIQKETIENFIKDTSYEEFIRMKEHLSKSPEHKK